MIESKDPSCLEMLAGTLIYFVLSFVGVFSVVTIVSNDIRVHRIEDKLGLDRSLTPFWMLWIEGAKNEPKK